MAFYKQALRYDLFKKMKVATALGLGAAPHALGKDHPEGVIGGVHANYHFTYPPGNQWPPNARFVKKYYERWKEYPNYEAEGAYYKDAVTGFTMNSPKYPFPVLDPKRIITIPIRNVTAPPGWPKGEPTSTYTWIEQTWPKAY